nr:immunoglobulin heavy chain junction region [Macaca mulatta]
CASQPYYYDSGYQYNLLDVW